MKDTTSDALAMAEELRVQHNGIFGVRLFLGHDGHNVCTLENYDGEIGRGESGTSLLEAVKRAASSWRYRNLTETIYGKQTVDTALKNAVERFGDHGDSVFNTACFEWAINTDAYTPLTGRDIGTLLESNPHVVRLHGGAHWMLLPNGYTRYDSGDLSIPIKAAMSSVGTAGG